MRFDLAIIGSGSAASIPPEVGGMRIALIEGATPYGGTCLNHGCIPTKMLVHPADLAGSVDEAERLGVDLRLAGVRWTDIRDRIFAQRIDRISRAGYEWRRSPEGGATVYDGWARFTAPGRLRVELHDGTAEDIEAERVLIGAGSRPFIPDIPGLDAVRAAAPDRVHTNQTIMRVATQPRRLLIVGGGFVGCEFAHIFSGFGTEVTQVVRSSRLLRNEDADVSARMTELAPARWRLMVESRVAELSPARGGGVRARVSTPDGDLPLDVDAILLATGRVPNSDRLGLEAAGVAVHPDGRIAVDEFQRTTAAGVFALGDVSSEHMLKHVANHEARVAFHNLAHPDALIAADHRHVPHAVFTHPQIAAVGLTEQQARERLGADVTIAVEDYGSVAYGWAMEDTTGFVKLVADRRRDRLVGAHLIGPQASTLVQTLVQAMSFEQPASALARGQYWIHPALPEVIENALLSLELGDPGQPDPLLR